MDTHKSSDEEIKIIHDGSSPSADDSTKGALERVPWYSGLDAIQVASRGEDYARAHLREHATPDAIRDYRIGAVLASHTDYPLDVAIAAIREAGEELTDDERKRIRDECAHRWRQPMSLYRNVIICSLSAATMGMDETVINGAQGFFRKQFHFAEPTMTNALKLGAINAAPYLTCAFVACWFTESLNRHLGRRGTIMAVSFLSAAGCVLSAFATSPVFLALARVILGLGIGPNSATTPMFAAECAPKHIRGALTMQWQVWTAFGIMVGYASSIALWRVPDLGGTFIGTNWRLMLASAGIPAVLVILLIGITPESPRWYLTKRRHADAFMAMKRLRWTGVQAARDVFQAFMMLQTDDEIQMQAGGIKRLKELVKIRRNRRAFIASEIVMFLQQFSGVNIIAYYSSEIFLQAKFTQLCALGTSFGFGFINFVFALPAFFTIDRLGRRFLLLITVPFMALALVATGSSFWIKDRMMRIRAIAISIYIFGALYSPGAGPVPFTYSAEAYPLYIRPLGMSVATATTWFFNSMLALTWPLLMYALKPQGAFMFYAGMNLVAFVLVMLFVPETKDKTLEELDDVFDVSAERMVRYGIKEVGWFLRRYIFCVRSAARPERPTRDS